MDTNTATAASIQPGDVIVTPAGRRMTVAAVEAHGERVVIKYDRRALLRSSSLLATDTVTVEA